MAQYQSPWQSVIHDSIEHYNSLIICYAMQESISVSLIIYAFMIIESVSLWKSVILWHILNLPDKLRSYGTVSISQIFCDFMALDQPP